MKREQRIHRGLVRRRRDGTGEQGDQLAGLGSLLLSENEGVGAGNAVGGDGLEADHRLLERVGPVRPLGGASHRLETFGRLLRPGGILAGEVQIGVGRLAEIAGAERSRARLGPDPRGGLPARQRAVLLQRLGILTTTVGLVAPALAVGRSAAGR